mgnify:CR=1 FL=1
MLDLGFGTNEEGDRGRFMLVDRRTSLVRLERFNFMDCVELLCELLLDALW